MQIKNKIPVVVKKAAWEACNGLWYVNYDPEIITIKFGIEVVKTLGPQLMSWRQDEDLFGIPYEFPEDPYPTNYCVAIWARKPEEAFCLRLVHLYEIEQEQFLQACYMTDEEIMRQGPNFPDRAILWDYTQGFVDNPFNKQGAILENSGN